MNRLISKLVIIAIVFFTGFVFFSCNVEKKTKVLVITGGHDYDKAGFEELLAKLPMTYDHVEHPAAYSMLAPENVAPYDVILFYDMQENQAGEHA